MKTFTVLLMLLFLGCSQTPVVENVASQEQETAGLYRVSGTVFDNFYIKSAAAMSSYSGIFFETLNLDQLKIDQRRLEIRDREWTLDKKEKEKIKKYFAHEVEDVFAKGADLALVERAGSGVLKASFEFVEFVPSATKDDISGRPVRTTVFTESVGSLLIKAKVTDSLTGELIAVLEDKEEVGDRGYLRRNDRVNNIRLMKIEMEKWIREMKRTLELISVNRPLRK